MLADYHMHTSFSDDSSYPMQDCIKRAIMLGFDEICFTEHIDYFQKHKEYIKKSPYLSKIVIDFMSLYGGGGLISGAGFCLSNGYKIFLGDLLDLWDSGFCYNGCPIVFCELRIHWSTHYTIKFIKDKKIETIQKKFEGHHWFLPEIGEDIFKQMKKANINSKFPDMATYKNIETIMKKIQ